MMNVKNITNIPSCFQGCIGNGCEILKGGHLFVDWVFLVGFAEIKAEEDQQQKPMRTEKTGRRTHLYRQPGS
jgi:hypothetical protein